MSLRLRRAAVVAFFAGLAALELGHGVSRFATLRGRRVEALVDGARAAHRDLAISLRTAFAEQRRHAAYWAKAPVMRAFAADPGSAEARRVATAQLLAYLAAFDGFDAVRVFDGRGVERLQCRRIGSGVGAISEGLLPKTPLSDPAAFGPRPPPGAPMLTGFAYDAARVEVPESERQVAHVAARIHGDAEPPATVVLVVYMSPLLTRVRSFEAAPGASTALVDSDGRYLAAFDRARERGGPREGRLEEDAPDVAAAAAAAEDFETSDDVARRLASRVVDEPAVRLVTTLPTASLEAAAVRELAGEDVRILAGTAVVMVLLAAALWYFLRLAARAARQRETERALAEAEARGALERRLASAERLSTLGLLTAGVAHEINNPLEGIGNYLTLLERAGDDADKRRRHLEAVRHGFGRIRDLVRELLNFGRPGTGQASCDAGLAVARAVDMARFGRTGEGVRFEATGFETPVRVACDPGRLEQVALNLLLNASKAIRGAGRATGCVTVRATREVAGGREVVCLVFEDDGPGIPPDVLPKLFDPFFTTGGGSGLGLAVTLGIVQAHGGDVGAENRETGGARFVVRLPPADETNGERA